MSVRNKKPSKRSAPHRPKGRTAKSRRTKSQPALRRTGKPRAASAKGKAKAKAAVGSKARANPSASKAHPARARRRERAQGDKGRDKAKAKKEQERQRAQREKQTQQERLRAEKLKERAQKEKEKEKERERLQKEKARLKLQHEREQQRELLRKQKEREQEKLRLQKQQEAERALKLKAREEERIRLKAEREAERLRRIAEREAEREELRRQKEAEREELRRQKEAERARKEAEREEYRKAKEAERERLRAEREAARRALEGKVARASKRGQRGDGLLGRGTTTRVYRPDAIPDQSGTTRRLAEAAARLTGVRPAASMIGTPELYPLTPPAAFASPSALAASAGAGLTASDSAVPAADSGRGTPPPPPTLSVEERWARINERLQKTDASFQREYRESFDMSWIYHDSALEGVVYTFQELKTATDPSITVVPDSSLQPVCEEIRRNRQAIELVRELSEKKRVPLSVDVLKKLYVTLHPEEGDIKTVKYRKDIPQHRLYFHEYAPPDKIAYKVRQVIDWLNGPEPKKIKNSLRVAARVHYDLLRIFPFQNDSGKVVRLLMNVILMRAGYPPAIVHSTERQKYYEALKGQLPVIISMTNEAISNALLSIEKRLDEYEARARGIAPS